MAADITVDTRGTYCPMPMVQAKTGIEKVAVGQVMELLADDVGSKTDMPAWANNTGHELISSEQDGDTFRFLVRRTR